MAGCEHLSFVLGLSIFLALFAVAIRDNTLNKLTAAIELR